MMGHGICYAGAPSRFRTLQANFPYRCTGTLLYLSLLTIAPTEISELVMRDSLPVEDNSNITFPFEQAFQNFLALSDSDDFQTLLLAIHCLNHMQQFHSRCPQLPAKFDVNLTVHGSAFSPLKSFMFCAVLWNIIMLTSQMATELLFFVHKLAGRIYRTIVAECFYWITVRTT
jgi:hypothetical protein